MCNSVTVQNWQKLMCRCVTCSTSKKKKWRVQRVSGVMESLLCPYLWSLKVWIKRIHFKQAVKQFLLYRSLKVTEESC